MQFLMLFVLAFFLSACSTRGTLTKLEFEQVAYTENSLATYPFLKNATEFVRQVQGERIDVPRPLQVWIAEIEIPDIVLVYYTGSVAGGNAGGSLTVYNRLPSSGFRQLIPSISTGSIIHKLDCRDTLYLILGGPGFPAYNKWKVKTDTVTYTTGSNDLSSLAYCR